MKLIHEILDNAVQRSCNKVAVISNNWSITYK